MIKKTYLNKSRETQNKRLLKLPYPHLSKRFLFKKREIVIFCSAVFLILVLLFSFSLTNFNPGSPFSISKELLGIPCMPLASVSSEFRDNFAESNLKDYVEELGGDGPAVAVYIRVSTGKAAREGYSMETQYKIIKKLMKTKKLKPSRIYWFFDPGKSGSHNYEKRKMKDILDLRKRGLISELWTYNIDRMGRETRKLLDCYYEFVDSGGRIVTPEKEYSKEDFSSEFQFFFEAAMAERSTKLRTAASIEGAKESFRTKHWIKSKNAPRGYIALARVIKKDWLKKAPEFDPIVKAASWLYRRHQKVTKVREKLNKRFKKLLGQEPLTDYQVMAMLLDSLYSGQPEHMGEVVIDSSLEFITEKTRQKNLIIRDQNRRKNKLKTIGPMEEEAIEKSTTLLEMMKKKDIVWVHNQCGGRVKKNGTDPKTNQQLLKCKKCPKAWRLPPIPPKTNRNSHNRKKRQQKKKAQEDRSKEASGNH